MSTTPRASEPSGIDAGADLTPPVAISFSEALGFWLKLGFISFGGPAGQIAIMHQELVERRRWISERRFLHALNYCMLLPGPEAQQLATYIGWLMHRTLGGVVAGARFVLPSLLILIVLSWIYVAFGNLPLVAGILYGIKPAVTAIVLFAAYRIGSRALKNGVLWAIAAAAFIAIFVFQIPFPWIILGAGVVGTIGGRKWPALFVSGSHQGSKEGFGPAIIDDQTPTPEHAQFTWFRLGRVVVIGIALWAVVMRVIIALFGTDGVLTKMGWFFTKAALLTFGGAYAVLPYVFQGAVEGHGWLTAGQMIDGFALGETTPGPLIMVVAFVGFVGGWGAMLFGPEHPFLAGTVAAMIVTYFTFLPSFIFILAGGPVIETTHQQPRITAPLTAITAAVVGVIVNLAAFFAYHVLWPHGFQGEFEWPLLVIGLAAGVAVLRCSASAPASFPPSWSVVPQDCSINTGRDCCSCIRQHRKIGCQAVALGRLYIFRAIATNQEDNCPMHTQNLSGWAHEHVFEESNYAAERGTRAVMWITAAMMVVEIAAGLWFNSMALLADGWHMSSHALAIGLSAFAYAAARRYARDARFAFGTWKIEVLGGFASAIFLLGIAGLMVFASVERIFSPQPIHYQEAIAVAIVGLIVNVVCATILGRAHDHHDHAHGHEGHHHHDLNLKSAYTHVIADAATSVLAIVALAGGWLYGWSWLDPVMGIVGAALVAFWAKNLLVETGKVLLDREMDHPVVEEIREAVETGQDAGETRVSDLHVWRVGRQSYACALSLITHDASLTPERVREQLSVHEEIVHATVEIQRCP